MPGSQLTKNLLETVDSSKGKELIMPGSQTTKNQVETIWNKTIRQLETKRAHNAGVTNNQTSARNHLKSSSAIIRKEGADDAGVTKDQKSARNNLKSSRSIARKERVHDAGVTNYQKSVLNHLNSTKAIARKERVHDAGRAHKLPKIYSKPFKFNQCDSSKEKKNSWCRVTNDQKSSRNHLK